MYKIIFITPFFENTGSDITLFNLIIRITGFEVIVISRVKGALANRLPAHIQFYDYRSFRKSHKKSILLMRLRNKVLKLQTSIFEYFLDSVIGSQNALFYVNTITMPEVINYLQKKNYKFFLHCHELQHMLIKLKEADVINIVNGADFVIASSKTCKDVLNTLGRYNDIVHSYPGIDIKDINPSHSNHELKKALKIPAGAFVIAMSGTIDSNKNPEDFLEIGKILANKKYNVHLLWIGVSIESGYYYFLRRKTAEYKLEMNCTWVMKVDGEAYYDYLNMSDCFILTSRRESFSIVLLEALALGKPVFSFESGGPQEIINDKSIGLLIEDHSVDKMAEAIEKLIRGEIKFNAERAKARAMNFSADEAFENWFNTIKKRVL